MKARLDRKKGKEKIVPACLFACLLLLGAHPSRKGGGQTGPDYLDSEVSLCELHKNKQNVLKLDKDFLLIAGKYF